MEGTARHRCRSRDPRPLRRASRLSAPSSRRPGWGSPSEGRRAWRGPELGSWPNAPRILLIAGPMVRFPGNQLLIGHDQPLNPRRRPERPAVAQLRRVVISRQCTHWHLQRVMVETPPRAGPYPPHGPARFLCSRPPPALPPALHPRLPATRSRDPPSRPALRRSALRPPGFPSLRPAPAAGAPGWPGARSRTVSARVPRPCALPRTPRRSPRPPPVLPYLPGLGSPAPPPAGVGFAPEDRLTDVRRTAARTVVRDTRDDEESYVTSYAS